MPILVVEGPASLPVDAETAMRQLGIDGADAEPEDIERLIQAVTEQLDGPTGWLGRCLISQTLELRLNGFIDRTPIEYPPVQEVAGVYYDDASGSEQTVAEDVYRLVGQPRPSLILASGKSWPSASGEEECVRIRWLAGYGEPDDVPAGIKQAILLMVKSLYDLGGSDVFATGETVFGVGQRTFSLTDGAIRVVQTASENLLSGYKVYS